jgi:branched-chain amino acid transport system substrate-binding protein
MVSKEGESDAIRKEREMKRRMVNIGLVFILVLLLVQTAESQQKGLDWDNPIKVGYINPFTGPATRDTARDVPGLQLAIEEINAAGGVLGRPFKLITRDSKLSPENALREAKDLILNEKVFWIQGITSSAVARAVSDYMKGQRKLLVLDVAKSEKLTTEWGHRYIFRATNNAYAEGVAMAKGCRQTFGPLKKIYNLSPDYEGGHSAWRTFFESYKKLIPDAKVVGEAWAKLGTQDYTSFLTAIMNSGAELMFTCLYQTDGLTMLKQSDTLGLNGKIPVAGFWLGAPGVVENYNAKFYPKKMVGGVSSTPFWALDTPEGKSFVEKIKSKFGVYPGYGTTAYAFFKAVAKAIEKAGALDTEKVIDNLEGYVMESPLGPIEIRSCDHQAMTPVFMGLIEELPGWDFYGPKNIIKIGKEAYPTCEEIAKARGK